MTNQNQLPAIEAVLTVPEAAAYLRVSRSTIWRWCQDGTLSTAFKIGRNWRVHRAEVEGIMGQSLPTQNLPEAVEQT